MFTYNENIYDSLSFFDSLQEDIFPLILRIAFFSHFILSTEYMYLIIVHLYLLIKRFLLESNLLSCVASLQFHIIEILLCVPFSTWKKIKISCVIIHVNDLRNRTSFRRLMVICLGFLKIELLGIKYYGLISR